MLCSTPHPMKSDDRSSAVYMDPVTVDRYSVGRFMPARAGFAEDVGVMCGRLGICAAEAIEQMVPKAKRK